MPYPTFNDFELNDGDFITERIVFKGYASRSVVRAQRNRREGVKLLGAEFGEKEVTIEGVCTADSASDLQSDLDDMKKALTEEEGSLLLEEGRTFRATVTNLMIPDEHYNVSKAPWEITFVCSDPFATGASQSVTMDLPSGILTYSGTVVISGSFFARPTIIFTPPTGKSGPTGITSIEIAHTPTGQSTTVSGFGSGTSLAYTDPVTINFDTLTAVESSSEKATGGSFPRWDTGTNQFTFTVEGTFPGGTLELSYSPRYL